MSDRSQKASMALTGVGVGATATGINANRIANTVNAQHRRNYDQKIIAATGGYGRNTAGHEVDDPRLKLPKDGAGRTVYANKEQRHAVRAKSQELVRNKHRVINDLKASRAQKVIGQAGRSHLMRGSIAVAVPATWIGARGSVDKRDVTRSDVDTALVAGATGGAGYQAAGFYPIHPIERRNEKKIADDPVLRAKAKAYRKASGVPANAQAGHPAWKGYFHNYPKDLPGGRLNRVLSRTHAGPGGVVLTAGVGAASATGAVGLLRNHQKKNVKKSEMGTNWPRAQRHGKLVAIGIKPKTAIKAGAKVFTKSLYVRDHKTSKVKVLEAGVGAGLLGYGLSRSPMLGAALARGLKQATNKEATSAITALRLAQSAQGAARRGTAIGERQMRQIRSVDRAVSSVPASIRPAIASAAGILLLGNAHPIRRTTYHPINLRIRTGVNR